MTGVQSSARLISKLWHGLGHDRCSCTRKALPAGTPECRQRVTDGIRTLNLGNLRPSAAIMPGVAQHRHVSSTGDAPWGTCRVSARRGRLRLKPHGRDRRLKPRAGTSVPVRCHDTSVSGPFRQHVARTLRHVHHSAKPRCVSSIGDSYSSRFSSSPSSRSAVRVSSICALVTLLSGGTSKLTISFSPGVEAKRESTLV